MRRTIQATLALVVMLALAIPAGAEGEPEGKIMPLVGFVPREVLDTPVFATDVAMKDFGVRAARHIYKQQRGSKLTGQGVEVCVVDTGVYPRHEQLDSKSIAWLDVINGRPEPYDDHGHGTHVASIAVGDGKDFKANGRRDKRALHLAGVAPKADLSAAKVLDFTGAGTFETVITGLDWCAQRPSVDVINMSIGTNKPSDGSDALSIAVNTVVSEYHKVVVISAGNLFEAVGTIASPGAALEAVTVGAAAEWSSKPGSDQYSSGPWLAPFSSRGGNVKGHPASPYLIKPDVVAPGVTYKAALAGTIDGYIQHSGTSMAAPFVAGVAALFVQVYGPLTDIALIPRQFKDALRASAWDLGPEGFDIDWGFGLVDTYALFERFHNPSPKWPPVERLSGTVERGSEWSYAFEVTDTTKPVSAVVITQNGDQLAAWEPTLDVALYGPDGELADFSNEPYPAPFGYSELDSFPHMYGRQQTVSLNDGTTTTAEPPEQGFYNLVVRINPYQDERNEINFDTASFSVDLFHG